MGLPASGSSLSLLGSQLVLQSCRTSGHPLLSASCIVGGLLLGKLELLCTVPILRRNPSDQPGLGKLSPISVEEPGDRPTGAINVPQAPNIANV
jgi:hypothetical protein